jgi:hypothetical protein
MAIRYDGQPPVAPQSPPTVRVLRVEAGHAHEIWTLSPELGGLFTHYSQKRSHYCPGPSCTCPLSRLQRVWKGYIAALCYVKATDDWHAVVLEISEHAELDMRGVYRRGQGWELSRPAERRGRHGPVVARLVTTETPATLPAPFPIEKVLRHLYHEDEIDLRHANPLPERISINPISAKALATKGEGKR